MESKQSAWNKNKPLFAKKELEQKRYEIGVFMNWFIKHYSTAIIDGMFVWVNSMDKEVTLKEILDEYYNQTYNN
jgi:hypothetical protein